MKFRRFSGENKKKNKVLIIFLVIYVDDGWPDQSAHSQSDHCVYCLFTVSGYCRLLQYYCKQEVMIRMQRMSMQILAVIVCVWNSGIHLMLQFNYIWKEFETSWAFPWSLFQYKLHHAKICSQACVDSEGPDQTARLCSLIRAVTVH